MLPNCAVFRTAIVWVNGRFVTRARPYKLQSMPPRKPYRRGVARGRELRPSRSPTGDRPAGSRREAWERMREFIVSGWTADDVRPATPGCVLAPISPAPTGEA